jgi:hypothetical protein
MAFFPLIDLNIAKGFCTIHNFGPNNFEKIKNSKKNVWALYSNGEKWITKDLGEIKVGDSKTYYYNDIIENTVEICPLVLLQFRKTPLNNKINSLPHHEFNYHKVPEWRSTVGILNENTQTSYQGEINPFPPYASLLTFHPFIQYNNISNYLVFISLEKTPKFRYSYIEIYDSKSKIHIDNIKVLSNHVNLIPLDKYNFKKNQLPIFLCRDMAGIPFGFGVSSNLKMLSFEHTHPPGMFAVHGDRFGVQKQIKSDYFDIFKPNE